MQTQSLLNFMHERHSIYIKKEMGRKPPWSKDPILQKYYFCNVYRELDKVTIAIKNYIRKPYAKNNNLWFMLAIARQFNLPSTLFSIMNERLWPVEKWEPRKIKDLLSHLKDSGEKLYNSAYMITGSGAEGKEKHHLTIDILTDLWKSRRPIEEALKQNSLETAWKVFLPFRSWGPFMSYELVTDLRHTRYLNRAKDIYTWANAGPGAVRGLNRLIGVPLNSKWSRNQSVVQMREILDDVSNRWKSSPKLEMRDIEHSLCEFDKYMRCKEGLNGRRMRIYNGASV